MIFVNILVLILLIIAGIIALLAALFLLVGFISLFADRNRFYDKESRFYRFVLTSTTAIAKVIVRAKFEVTGMDKVPEGRFLLVGNHLSNFDPIFTWLVFAKQHIAFISKPENFKIPIYGRIIRKCCFMDIDRENPRKAAKAINQAAQLLKDDQVSVGVYPEGTRNSGEGLLPFHSAVFKIAIKAGVPIVVLTVLGAENIHKNFPFKRTVVRIDVLDVISAERVKQMKTAEIGELVREEMLSKIEEN